MPASNQNNQASEFEGEAIQVQDELVVGSFQYFVPKEEPTIISDDSAEPEFICTRWTLGVYMADVRVLDQSGEEIERFEDATVLLQPGHTDFGEIVQLDDK